MKALVDRRYVSIVLVLCMIAATVSLMFAATPVKGAAFQQPFEFRDGEEERESFARSLALMDLNGDGIADLVVGVPFATVNTMKNAGSVRVYLSSGGTPLSEVVYINGTHGGDSFGWAVANVGDLDGDGDDDLAVGAPYADAGAVNAGNVTLFFGWSKFSGKANVSINSTNAGEGFGYALSAAGQVDGDSKDDMIVGAPFYSSATLNEVGSAYIFYGGDPMDSVADMLFLGDVANGHFGFSVSGNANVDSDTSMDMVVGAPDEKLAGAVRGAVHIFRNLDRATPQTGVVRGAAVNDRFGYCVMMINDMNGDSYDDIAIGAPYNDENGTDAGEVSILYGGAKFNEQVDLVLMGQAPYEQFGFSIASGDFREDTYCDLIVGAPNSSLNATFAGRAYIFYGGSTPSAYPSVILVPETGSNFLGGSAAVGGNMTGDAAPDFAVGDPLFNLPGLPNAGRAYVYAGVQIITQTNPKVWGYVYSSTEVGLQGFTVTLQSQSTTFNKSATTTPNGSYGVSPVEITAVPGTYWLNASMPGYVLNSTTITLVMDQVKRQDFYPDTVPIVWGVVTEVPATAIRGATVVMYNGSSFVQSAVTPVNGTYWMPLPTAFIPAAGNQTDLTIEAWGGAYYLNWTNVTVSRGDTKRADIQLDKFPVVTGVVRDAISSSAVRNAVIVADQGGVVLGTATSDLRGGYRLVAVNATVPGPLYLNVTAPGYWNDSGSVAVAKNAESTQDFFLLSDTTPPTSSITTTLQPYTNTTVIALDAMADDDQGIQEVQLWYRHGGSGNYLLYGADQTSPYSFAFNTGTTGGDGLYEFYTRAVDIAANIEAAPATNDTWTYVDTHAPVLTITAPTEGQTFATSTVAVTWTGSDTGSGILWYRVQLDASAWIDKGTATSHSFTGVADGPHSINVTASDKALLETGKMVNVTVDTTDAVSQVDALPTYTASVEISLTATATDANGIQEVQLWYRFNATGAFVYFGRDTTAPYTFQFNTSNIQGDGLYEFYSKAIDDAGHNESAPAGNDTWTIVDSHAPTVTISSPTAGQLIAASTVAVAWTGSDAGSGLAKYEVQLDAASWVDKGLATSHSFTSVSDGSHLLSVRVTDNAGLTNTTSVDVTVDATSAVSLVSPLPTYTTSVEISLTATATDANGIQEVQLWWRHGGAGAYSYFDRNTSSPYNFLLNTSAIAGDGLYEFYSKAIDGAGNNESAPAGNDTWTIVDTAPPTLSITAPTAGQNVSTVDVVVSWTGSDSASGIASFLTSIDGGSSVDRGGSVFATFASLADGSHTVNVTAMDRAGHSTIRSVTFNLDTAKPIVLIMAPVNNSALSSASITLQWSASDVGSGIETLQVSSDGTTWQSVAVGSTEFSFYGPSGIPEGVYTLYVRAVDHGGLTTTATVNTILDRTNPTVTMTFPIPNQELKDSKVTVAWAMLDTGSGVSQARISIDGGTFTSVGNATSYDIAKLDDGTHRVTVRVTDNAGNFAEASVEFTVSTGGGISAVVIGAIAVVVIVAIAAAALLATRKKKPESEKKEPEK